MRAVARHTGGRPGDGFLARTTFISDSPLGERVEWGGATPWQRKGGRGMKWWVEREGRRVDLSVRCVGEGFEVTLDGRVHRVDLVAAGGGLSSLLCDDGRSFAVAAQKLGPTRFRVSLGERDFEVHLRDPLEREIASAPGVVSGRQEVRAPIPGKVVRVDVTVGASVTSGQPLLVLEAMKMENQICAEGSGSVGAVLVSPGQTVEGGQILIVVE